MFITKCILILTITSGWASQYAPGVMERVIRIRQSSVTSKDLPMELPSVFGFIAMESCDRIGDIIYLRPEGTNRWYSFMVADCSGHAETTAWMKNNNILVELWYPAVEPFGGRRNRGIRIEMKEIEERRGYVPY
jgi:hypothetical protein